MTGRGKFAIVMDIHMKTKAKTATTLLVAWLLILSGCQRSQFIELVSKSPHGPQSMAVFLEHHNGFFKNKLLLVAEDKGRKVELRVADIARVTDRHVLDEWYEVGMCFAEVAWPSREVAAVYVKNCLGSTTFVAYDFGRRKLLPGTGYEDSMREAIRRRYGKELREYGGDPIRWVVEAHSEVQQAYLYKKLGDGRMMGE